MTREQSLKEAKRKMKRATSGKEMSEAMREHFKRFPPKKNLAKSPKQEDMDNFIDYLSRPITEDVKLPIFQGI